MYYMHKLQTCMHKSSVRIREYLHTDNVSIGEIYSVFPVAVMLPHAYVWYYTSIRSYVQDVLSGCGSIPHAVEPFRVGASIFRYIKT